MSWQIEDEGNVRNKKRIFILKFVFLESDRIVNKFFSYNIHPLLSSALMPLLFPC